MRTSLLIFFQFCVGCLGFLGLAFLTGCPSFTPLPVSSTNASTLAQPYPGIDAVSPGWITGGTTQPLVLTVYGSNFDSNTRVLWIGNTIYDQVSTTYVSSTQVTATIPAGYASSPIPAPISVMDASRPTITPNSIRFFVLAANSVTNPGLVPVISSLLPGSISVGQRSVAVIVMGSNFDATSTIEVNGIARGTVWTASNGVNMSSDLMANETATAGSLQVVVINDPDIAPSAPASLPITP